MAVFRRIFIAVAVLPSMKPPLSSNITPPSCKEGTVAVEEEENDEDEGSTASATSSCCRSPLLLHLRRGGMRLLR
ncbi:hypothetical protein PIB30_094753, partial [Stylosanthes scabra]|nr:hypothetical protein [Stylosanthes scabra]